MDINEIIARAKERAKHMPKDVGFEVALKWLKEGDRIRRDGWKGRRKWVEIIPAHAGVLSFPAIIYEDNTTAPWTPTRCDLLMDDWEVLPDMLVEKGIQDG